MEENSLLMEKEERICTMTLNRPERRNALSLLLLTQLAEALTHLKEEDEVRCIIIRGAGDKAFSSGLEISAIPVNLTPATAASLKEPMEIGVDAIIKFPYPVIAMLNGYAYGGGLELALACDIRIAADNVQMGIPAAKIGVVYQSTAIMRMISTVGLANAKEIFLTGRYYDASRAKEMGLINQMVPRDLLAAFTHEMAQELSENAPLSLRGMKMIFNKLSTYQKIDPDDGQEIAALRVKAFNSEDLKEGRRAISEKRKPVFKGR